MKIQRDKLLHLAAGFLTGLSSVWLCWYALIPVIAVGAGKEWRDEYYYILDEVLPQWIPKKIRAWLARPGTPDRWDAIATFVGGAISTSLIMLFF